jgi:hypothetical protein
VRELDSDSHAVCREAIAMEQASANRSFKRAEHFEKALRKIAGYPLGGLLRSSDRVANDRFDMVNIARAVLREADSK